VISAADIGWLKFSLGSVDVPLAESQKWPPAVMMAKLQQTLNLRCWDSTKKIASASVKETLANLKVIND